jgi:hypothetical protein
MTQAGLFPLLNGTDEAQAGQFRAYEYERLIIKT